MYDCAFSNTQALASAVLKVNDMRERKQHSKIPVDEVARLSREVANAQPHSVEILGVMAIEGGSDHVELFVSDREKTSGHELMSVVIDRAVPVVDFQRSVALILRDAFAVRAPKR
jgi:hypothetical protein